MPSEVVWTHLQAQKSGQWVIARSYDQFVETIRTKGLPTFIAFDYDLSCQHLQDLSAALKDSTKSLASLKLDYNSYNEKTGYDCAKWLVEYCSASGASLPDYDVHSMHPIGAENIRAYLSSYSKPLSASS